MLNQPNLRLVGVDMEDEVEELAPPETYSFLEWARRLDRDIPARTIDPIKFALSALDDVSRRMEDLARELNIAGDNDDTDRPRAA